MTEQNPASAGRQLSRPADGRQAAPVRLVHLGVGNFFRAHQAWYTAHAADADQWGIEAYTGRSRTVADQLAPQQGLYTLVTAHREGHQYEVIDSISAVHPADEVAALLARFADENLAVVTSTITEAGYLAGRDGGLDLTDPRVQADVTALRGAGEPGTAPGRIVAGLMARRAALGQDAPLTLVPCDNLSGNGALLRRVVFDLAGQVDPGLVDWIVANVAFITTMVDRITPRTTEEDLAAVLADTGVVDPAAVVTEPFSEWVLEGQFAAGHPDWASAGARFVDDVAPYETRKLWLLNGSHSLMAYAAPLLGHRTVHQAINDPVVRGWVEQWWDVAAAHLSLPAEQITAYRQALIDRYDNPQVVHQLAQIAADGSTKLPIRIIPALQAELAQGRVPEGALRAIAAWLLHLRGQGAPVHDVAADPMVELASGDLTTAVPRVLADLGVTDERATEQTLNLVTELEQLTAR